ncbi:DNA-3-methyladenine glycosylase [Aestuariimicrobium ganziense]|uniref:DNA-3-methyladenine glycosylase n=1 Tax=Aestuariimicrobium ganziense TaxID=2773677 RepID=UPI001943C16F|nr:DNA-3-methyladenine glycosylase [Aestuariimicrobium ganziense]
MPPADLSVLAQPVLEVAPLLLGGTLTSTVGGDLVRLRITEVEAYDGANDPGSHAYRGLTPRTEVMFGAPGHLYVYFSYGMHWCANVVTGEQGRASAVLLRAGGIIEGHDIAQARRPACRRPADLARGPARLAAALGIDRDLNGHHLVEAPLVLTLPRDPLPANEISTGPRVGVSGPGGDATKHPWRFWISGDPTVSAYRPGRVPSTPR